jgi:LmbE family N-acetylglucosaminyl deacetylase
VRIFVLAPHPDDEVLGAGGAIAWHVARGNEVHVGILTRGHPAIFSEDSIAQVRREAGQAHELLGISRTHFCDELPAPGLDTVPHHVVTQVIRGWLQEIKPEVFYIPHRGDIHIDHRLAYHAALVAARPGYSSVRRILCYETLSETEWSGPALEDAFLPNVFVDISLHLETKQAAMRAYKSQLKSFPNPRSAENIEALARLRGATVQVPAAEAFILIREICS